MSSSKKEIYRYLERLKEDYITDEIISDLDLPREEINKKIESLQNIFTPAENREANGKYFLYVDGASRNNPGPAGGGAVVYDENNEQVARDYRFFGSRLTNNAAEYRSLLLGLELLPEDCGQLKIHMDSELVIKQLTGEYSINSSNLKPYYERVKSRLEKFDELEFEAIPREENQQADKLANRALDERESQL
ncbi:MAG: ribonuclease HI family protein [bacterium]